MQEIKTQLYPSNGVVMGCDPEFFLEKNGKIIGSEKVIDIKEGLKTQNSTSKIIVDGVQIEINPNPSTCRQVLAAEISACFRSIYEKIKDDPTLKGNFNTTIEIDKTELESLDEKSRTFGCAPSKNKDKKNEDIVKLKDPSSYRKRSAGGHIHISPTSLINNPQSTVIFNAQERLIDMMDIIVGNTCVLIDTDKGNKERRKVYGRAGEYRTPKHGIEYRTLSNFWLKSYPLMSLVTSLSRLAVNIMAQSIPGSNYEQAILNLVDLKSIKKAINTNNYKLAFKNFKKIQPFLEQICPSGMNFPITKENKKEFDYFIKKGINHWFKEDPIQYWIRLPIDRPDGWESFIVTKVRQEMLADKTTTTTEKITKKIKELFKSNSKEKQLC